MSPERLAFIFLKNVLYHSVWETRETSFMLSKTKRRPKHSQPSHRLRSNRIEPHMLRPNWSILHIGWDQTELIFQLAKIQQSRTTLAESKENQHSHSLRPKRIYFHIGWNQTESIITLAKTKQNISSLWLSSNRSNLRIGWDKKSTFTLAEVKQN
jgi:hypothetical protein